MLPKKRLSLIEYARKRGCSLSRVKALTKSGKLSTKKTDGRLTVDPDEADQEWLDNVDHKRKPRTKEELSLPDDFDAETAKLTEGITEKNAGASRRVAEAKKEYWKALQAELDYKREAGDLIPAERVQRDAFEVSRIVRDSILVLPDRLSPELIGIKDQATMHSAMTKALNHALMELCNGIEKRFGLPAGIFSGDEAGSFADGQ